MSSVAEVAVERPLAAAAAAAAGLDTRPGLEAAVMTVQSSGNAGLVHSAQAKAFRHGAKSWENVLIPQKATMYERKALGVPVVRIERKPCLQLTARERAWAEMAESQIVALAVFAKQSVAMVAAGRVAARHHGS